MAKKLYAFYTEYLDRLGATEDAFGLYETKADRDSACNSIAEMICDMDAEELCTGWMSGTPAECLQWLVCSRAHLGNPFTERNWSADQWQDAINYILPMLV